MSSLSSSYSLLPAFSPTGAATPFGMSSLLHLKGGYRNFFYSFIGPVGHDIWWENSRKGSFGPKKGPKIANFLGLEIRHFSSGGWSKSGFNSRVVLDDVHLAQILLRNIWSSGVNSLRVTSALLTLGKAL